MVSRILQLYGWGQRSQNLCSTKVDISILHLFRLPLALSRVHKAILGPFKEIRVEKSGKEDLVGEDTDGMVDVVCIDYWVFLGLIGDWIACIFVFYGRECCMHLYHLG